MSQLAVPATMDEITADWLDRMFTASVGTGRPPVASLKKTVIGVEKGFLSETAIIELDFGGAESDLPTSVVAKLQPKTGDFVDTAKESHAFEREIRFYKELAPSAPIRLPRVYFSEVSDDSSLLIMEDLSHLANVDQVSGLTHERVVAAVRAIAKMHAAHWDSEHLHAKPWIPLHDHFFDEGFEDHWPTFSEAYGLRIGRAGRALGERVAANLRWIEQRISERPTTFVHGDFRADNLLFGPAGTPEEVLVLDWQLGNLSLGTIDITRLLGGSEPVAERQGHQFEIMEAWHDELIANGVREYSYDDALYDFRLGALYSLFIPVKVLHLSSDDIGPRAARLLDTTAERQFASALELDAGSLLPDN